MILIPEVRAHARRSVDFRRVVSAGDKQRPWSSLAVVTLACIPMFVALGQWPLMDPDEGRNAMVAQEMMATGSWNVPRFNGLPFLDKPPAFFWAVAGSFMLTQPGEASARLPSAVAGMAVAMLTFALGRALLNPRPAMWAAVIVATSPLILVFARLTIFDMLLTAFVTAALLCLVRRRLGGPAALWWPLAAIAMALAVLTKGPVGLALPLIAWTAGRGALPPAIDGGSRWAWVASCGVFLAILVPWLIAVTDQHPDFLRYALLDETVLRFTSEARFRRGGPWYYPIAVTLAGMGVWSTVMLSAAIVLWRRASVSAREWTASAFAARCAGAILFMFVISASKRPGYVLPAIVPVALIAGAAIPLDPSRIAAALRGTAVLTLSVVGCVAAYFMLQGGALETMASLIYRAATPRVVIVALAVCGAWSVLLIAIGTRSAQGTLGLAAAFAPALYLLLIGPLTPYAESRSARALARLVEPGATVVSFRHFRPSFAFYLGRPVLLATADGSELTSNYVASRATRFLAAGDMLPPPRARELIRTASSIVVLTAASWAAAVPRFRQPSLALVGVDQRSALWVSRD